MLKLSNSDKSEIEVEPEEKSQILPHETKDSILYAANAFASSSIVSNCLSSMHCRCLIKMFIFKAFFLTLVKKNCQMESAGKGATICRKKPSRDWLEKDQ